MFTFERIVHIAFFVFIIRWSVTYTIVLYKPILLQYLGGEWYGFYSMYCHYTHTICVFRFNLNMPMLTLIHTAYAEDTGLDRMYISVLYPVAYH